jgi:hypothetical protein
MKFLALAVFFAGFATYASADTVWNVNATFFRPGEGTNTVTGSFTVNSALSGLVAWNLDVTGTSLTGANYDYTGPAGNSTLYSFTNSEITLGSNPFVEYMELVFDSPLPTNAANGTTINLDSSSYVCPGCGTLVSGSITAGPFTPVPEPSSMLLFGSGLTGLLGFIRHKLCA